ncbi:MAG: J domain-containing protein [Cyanobacteriota bacterium]
MVGGSIPAERPGLNHYDRLGLTQAATPEDLRQAFRTLSKRYHPDTTTLPAAPAAVCFQAVQQAYAVLADPQRRRAYDDDLLAARRRSSLTTALEVPPYTAAATRSGSSLGGPLPVATSLRRALSGGEWLALLLLAVAMVLSLVLGLGLAWARGVALVRTPSWWSASVPSQSGDILSVSRSDARASSGADAALPPSPAEPGVLASGAGGPAAPSPFPPLDPGAVVVERGDRAQTG